MSYCIKWETTANYDYIPGEANLKGVERIVNSNVMGWWELDADTTVEACVYIALISFPIVMELHFSCIIIWVYNTMTPAAVKFSKFSTICAL